MRTLASSCLQVLSARNQLHQGQYTANAIPGQNSEDDQVDDRHNGLADPEAQ